MMQARKIRYDVIGLTETSRHRPLNATFDTEEKLFLGICDSRGDGGKWSPKPVIKWDLFISLAGFCEDTVLNQEYDRLVHHLRDRAKSAESSRSTKKRLSYEILELIRRRGAARAAGNYQLSSESSS
ncbi:hypothetical protein ANCCAN_11775 [Ancylostoma caninum]|uniref:Uncharacterized protein n=1 Tax=Ancylostoma caninum TaxID=29170 RepID=A0A368GD39_ANCCA|nr:hypothetical protein ANCCAN_11775 [Ancylostoma caninum]